MRHATQEFDTPAKAAHAACANCGTALVGAFCHACGQSGHVHRTAGAILHDIGHGVFHFEGKVWRTLPLLIWRPGELTRRYVAGERVRFVSPIALFLFSVFLMFVSIGLATGKFDMGPVSRNLASVNRDIGQQRVELANNIRRLERGRADAARDPTGAADLADVDRRLDKARADADALAAAQRTIGGDQANSESRGMNFETGSGTLDQKLRQAAENPELTLYKFKTAAYKYSWALIPLSLPFIWLLFPFSRRYGFYDHAVLATYSLSFMTLLVVAASVTIYAGAASEFVLFAAMLIAPTHMYAQLKGAYALGRAGALVRTALLVVFSFFTLTLFGLLLGYLGLA